MTEVTGVESDVATRLIAAGLGALVESKAWGRLHAASRVRRYGKAEVLWTAGSESRGFHVLLEGRIRILGSRHGRQHLVHVAAPGATLGEVPIFDRGGYPATAVAAVQARCWVVAPSAVRSAVALDPALAEFFLERLSGRIRTLVERLGDRTLTGVRTRLAGALVGMAAAQESNEIALPTPQSAWAEDLGTVREVLSRELSRLSKDGLIERTGRGRVTLIDEVSLERIALERSHT